MRALLESFHRPSAIVVLLLLAIAAILTVAEPPVMACDPTAQTSTTATRSCTRRVTVNSNPCGAMIYIDDIQVGRTPMSFPMPTGRYTLVLLAPGHERYAQRILVPDAPLEINAKLVPEK